MVYLNTSDSCGNNQTHGRVRSRATLPDDRRSTKLRLPKEVLPMDMFSFESILEVLQAVQLVLLIIKNVLEIRKEYKRRRMERSNE